MNGDIIVCGVSKDELVEDIGKWVPQGEPTRISGDQAHSSKDLWRLLSQSRLFRLNVNNLVRHQLPAEVVPVPELEQEYNKAVADVERLKRELTLARTEAISARAEVTLLRAENLSMREELVNSGKLDTILKMLKEMPTGVATTATPAVKSHIVELGDIPMYIPTQIKSDGDEGRVSISEESSDASSLSGASKALKEKRKKQQ